MIILISDGVLERTALTVSEAIVIIASWRDSAAYSARSREAYRDAVARVPIPDSVEQLAKYAEDLWTLAGAQLTAEHFCPILRVTLIKAVGQARDGNPDSTATGGEKALR